MTRIHRDPLAHLADGLLALEAQGLRRRPPAGPSAWPSFCSNDYLGLARRLPPPAEPAPLGAGAARLIAGEHQAHRRLEVALAAWLDVESCLLFTSGYAANVGVLSSVAAPGDLIVSDVLNHASIIDGARLSKARVVVTSHNDVEAIKRVLAERQEERAWVVVESYFSMDADGPDLAALRRICDASGAGLIVDEAHALGVLGPGGRGRAHEAGVAPDVLIGTLGKAFGAQGAFVGGRTVLRDWLWNRARSFVFSTGLSPLLAQAGAHALEHIQAHPEEREHVAALAAQLRAGLEALGFSVGGFGHVIPVLVDSIDSAIRLSQRLADEGILIPPIRPPTVPSARLRLTVTAAHSAADVDAVLGAFQRAVRIPPSSAAP